MGQRTVNIKDDQIEGQVSIPLDEVGEFAKGRYLNGSAVFDVGLAAGRLLVFVDSVEVKGKPLPDALMQQLRADNLAKNVNSEQDVSSFVDKLESITVENGEVRVVPKKLENDQAEEAPAT